MTKEEAQELVNAGEQCHCDNLRVPFRCPNQSTQVLEDSDGWFPACTECAQWWEEFNT